MWNFRLSINYKRVLSVLPLITLLVAGGLAAASGQVVLGSSPPAPPTPSQNGDLDRAQGLRLALADDQISAADRASLETKLTLAERAAARPTPIVANSLPPVVLPTVPLPTFPADGQPIIFPPNQDRIIDGSEGLVHAWEAVVQNTWMGQRNNVYYEVIAGALADDTAQGWLKVIENNQGTSSEHVYRSPNKNGWLRIQTVDGLQITLSTGSGGTASFDLATHAFGP